MANQMGNSRRGRDDLDRALDRLAEQDDDLMEGEVERTASGRGAGPVLGEGEAVGRWTQDEEDEESEDALDAARPDDIVESGDIIEEEDLYDDEGFEGGGGGYTARSRR